ncbi:Phosphoribosylaminoimidazole-succinocarboxamide synthase [Picochlorum sp. SENEW3]|nr:Phosphoribosylaminoimidazole-succinocarboxamide synthase [Picochlorum sp. SENEW3]
MTGRCRSSSFEKDVGIECMEGLRPEVDHAVDRGIDNCLNYTELGVGKKYEGKVRDTYDLGDTTIIVTTDRQSAFDRHLASIPFKGQVLNETSAWWMRKTTHIIPNALIDVPDPNISVMQKCTVFPVEFVCRGFMTGSTETSLWTHYNRGEREYCGNVFPDGMKKNEQLSHNVLTPTTKAADHDVPISPDDIVKQGLMSQEDWDVASAAALALFEFGQKEAASRGLLLVDTKYEFGKDPEGNIMLIDEIHTPDSSRYWIADGYKERLENGQEPQNIDKEFLRLWFRANCDPYNDDVLPEAPKELVKELSRRYIFLYETITGEAFVPADPDIPAQERIKEAISKYIH